MRVEGLGGCGVLGLRAGGLGFMCSPHLPRGPQTAIRRMGKEGLSCA